MKKFLKHLKINRGYSSNTIINYEVDIKEFFDYLIKMNLNLMKLHINK